MVVGPRKVIADLGVELAKAGLEDRAAAAAEWCERMGARDLEEISEGDVFDDLAEALQLKPLERRRLHRGILASVHAAPEDGARAAAQVAVAGGAAAASAAPSPGLPTKHAAFVKSASLDSPAGSTGQTVFVKNTFLDLSDGPRLSDIRRLKTAPAPRRVAREDLEDEPRSLADDDDPDGPSAAGDWAAASAGCEGNGLLELEDSDGLYKTVTCDGYEPSAEWSWLSGGTQHGSGHRRDLAPALEPADAADSMGCRGSGSAAQPEPADPVNAVGAAPYGSFFPSPVGMVMVPVNTIPAPFMPPVAAGFCFPGCVPVPVDRFARWPGDMQADADACSEARKRDNTLQRAFSVSSSIYRIRWTVDAKRLKSTDREAVSPTFELYCGSPMEFKMVIRPKKMEDARGGASFKKSRGRGTVQLRILTCIADSAGPTVTFRLAVGSLSRQNKPRGPVRHDFSEKPICGLPEGKDEWDFQKSVDEATQTFVVCLEVLSGTME